MKHSLKILCREQYFGALIEKGLLGDLMEGFRVSSSFKEVFAYGVNAKRKQARSLEGFTLSASFFTP